MTTLEMLAKLDRINVHESAQMAIMDTDRELARVQQMQLFSGLSADGRTIQPPYAESTIEAKRKKGQPTDRVTLKDTGAFYAGIIIDVRENTFVIDSADEKSGKLQDRYGEKIFGLNSESRIEYIKTLKPAFINEIRRTAQSK